MGVRWYLAHLFRVWEPRLVGSQPSSSFLYGTSASFSGRSNGRLCPDGEYIKLNVQLRLQLEANLLMKSTLNVEVELLLTSCLQI